MFNRPPTHGNHDSPELDRPHLPRYGTRSALLDVSIRRWQAWTGKAAVDAESGRTFDELADKAAEIEEGPSNE